MHYTSGTLPQSEAQLADTLHLYYVVLVLYLKDTHHSLLSKVPQSEAFLDQVSLLSPVI